MSLANDAKEEADATLPVNDAERWIAGTYAIWSEYCGGSYKYLGGYEKTKSTAKMVAKVLRQDWMIDGHKSGVDTVEYLIENAGPDDDDEYDEEYDDDGEYDEDEEYDDDDEDYDDADTTAFDYACACNMCGRMFIAGYMTREESIRYATEAAKKIQELYHSWEEYFEAYIKGAAAGSNVDEREPFEEAYRKFKDAPDSPVHLDWNTRL